MGIQILSMYRPKRSIEDWFLYDLEGIPGFLKPGKNKKGSGKNGYDKLQRLYKQANKVVTMPPAAAQMMMKAVIFLLSVPISRKL